MENVSGKTDGFSGYKSILKIIPIGYSSFFFFFFDLWIVTYFVDRFIRYVREISVDFSYRTTPIARSRSKLWFKRLQAPL